MSTQRGQKLNTLQHLLPEGLVVTASWLNDKSYSSALRSKYVSSGWLTQPVRGIYKRPGADTKWQHVVISLQSLMGQPIAVGGLSALELQGYGHYVRMGSEQRVYLYAEARLAKWVNEFSPLMRFEQRNAKKLFKEPFIEQAVGKLPELNATVSDTVGSTQLEGGLTQFRWGDREWPMLISSPERAILEFLDEIPNRQTFEHAADLFTGLANLRPRRLQTLLEQCDSVKVKRLFLWFAEQHQHAWLKHLDMSGIDIGSGKRVIATAGRLDPKYQITVPEALNAN